MRFSRELFRCQVAQAAAPAGWKHAASFNPSALDEANQYMHTLLNKVWCWSFGCLFLSFFFFLSWPANQPTSQNRAFEKSRGVAARVQVLNLMLPQKRQANFSKWMSAPSGCFSLRAHECIYISDIEACHLTQSLAWAFISRMSTGIASKLKERLALIGDAQKSPLVLMENQSHMLK